jgi:hypothetical protein
VNATRGEKTDWKSHLQPVAKTGLAALQYRRIGKIHQQVGRKTRERPTALSSC